MHLEQVETLCINYLRQCKSPLAPVSKLLEHCKRDPACGGLEMPELLTFLRKHGDIQVMEGPAPGEVVDPAKLAQAGLDMGPRAILNTRMPSPGELAAMMAQQIEVMRDALEIALAEAGREGGNERVGALREALGRAEHLREKMRQALGASE